MQNSLRRLTFIDVKSREYQNPKAREKIRWARLGLTDTVKEHKPAEVLNTQEVTNGDAL